MIPLTARQQELLDYLRSCERSPTYTEMRLALGLNSKSGIHRLVSALEERGYILRIPNRERAITLVKHPRLPDHLTVLTDQTLALVAKSRGLVLGRVHDFGAGPAFYEIDA